MIIEDLNRRPIALHKSKIVEVLPEYFRSEYPTFVTFLESYYDFLDSSATNSFDTKIQDLFSTRDIDQTPESLLDLIGKELGGGLSSTSVFSDPRYSLKRFGELFRTKGTPVGAEQFFRSFFDIEPEIIYPKENLFTVGASEVGNEGQKLILDHARNQIYSIVYKTPLALQSWSELYKRYAHPSGYYFAGEVLLEGQENLELRTMPTVEFALSVDPIVVGQAVATFAPAFEQFTVLRADIDGVVYRANPLETVDKYSSVTLNILDSAYDNFAQMYTPNSFKFDDSGNGVLDSAAPDFSLSFETFDQEMFDSYGKAY
jgi:phage tail-like protein